MLSRNEKAAKALVRHTMTTSVRFRSLPLVMVGALALFGLMGCGHSEDTTPVVTGSSSTSGSVSGGTLTLSGKNLRDLSAVTIGGQSAQLSNLRDDSATVTVPAAVSFRPGTVPLVVTAHSGSKPVSSRVTQYTYNVVTPVDKQLEYAMTYWSDYNTAQWGDFNPDGGDCANFVSQTLLARGWTMNSDWYSYDAGEQWSPAWGYVPALDAYLSENAQKLGLTEYPLSDRSSIKIGDLVVFYWAQGDTPDHIMVVSGVKKIGGKTLISMVGHNDNYDYRDLDQTITVDHPGATGHFWSIPD